MSRREDEEARVEISISGPISATIGDFDIFDIDIYAEQDGARVTDNKVIPNRKFDIVAEYRVKNNAWNILNYGWTTATTVFNETTGQPIGIDKWPRETKEETGQDRVAFQLSAPAHLRVKIWAHQEILSPGEPPQSEW